MVQYTLTNLGKQRPWREGILEAEPIKIQFENGAIEQLAEYCVLQDLRLPGSLWPNLKKGYASELPEIILGSSASWMLWKAIIRERVLELHYIDAVLEQGRKRQPNYRKCSVLLCQIPWVNGLRVRLSASTSHGDWEGVPSTYMITHRKIDDRETKKHEDALAVQYRILEEKHRDVYTITSPLRE